MHAGRDLPELFFARILGAAGPYRAGDGVAIAYAAPAVGRLVAIEATVRARCANYERTAIPEIVTAIVEHPCAPYVAGESLTLYFVDPGIARIQRDASQPQAGIERVEPSPPAQAIEEPAISYLADDAARSSPQVREGAAMTLRVDDSMLETPRSNESNPHEPAESAAADRASHERSTVERSTDGDVYADAAVDEPVHAASLLRGPSEAAAEPPVSAPMDAPQAGVSVRLEWSAQRVRRFIAVVDRLFTIDRLGWYRHALAMRLLIPDEIRSGDELADVEAMRHLHALRSAAVDALGKPLLAACMPGFTVTSDWLETLESAREARAIAGLRDALSPYATDRAEDTNDRARMGDVAYTVGAVSKRALLAENATSVESFLPILIPTLSHDAALGARLTDYRTLLLELFVQTARATDPVRLGALAQPNRSLDDRLWQLVGAVGEAFGGFVH